MPELPEVETIVQDLNKKIKGDTIIGFWSDWPKTIKNKSLQSFCQEIKGSKIINVSRWGKNIFIHLSNQKTIYIHLKMTGHLLVKSEKFSSFEKRHLQEKVNQYIHHIWKLKGKNEKRKTLEFSDLRKFGKIILTKTDKINSLKEIKKLGPDAMDKELTLDKFTKILKQRPQALIGLALMDQSLIAGIGNIYRSEILFATQISPFRKIKNLSGEEIKKIYQQMKKILRQAIKLRGTSDSDYRDTSGAPGSFQKVLRVYRQEGKPCSRCHTSIKREKFGGRSLFYCSNCQK